MLLKKLGLILIGNNNTHKDIEVEIHYLTQAAFKGETYLYDKLSNIYSNNTYGVKDEKLSKYYCGMYILTNRAIQKPHHK